MRRRMRLPAAAGDSGFIIVAVLWILAALAALTGNYAVYVASSIAPARVGLDRLRADGLIYAGLELTAYRLIGLDDASRPSAGSFSFQTAHANVAVEFRSEAARIDLNFASAALLSGLFKTLGADKDAAAYAAARIVGWRTKNTAPGQNASPGQNAPPGQNTAPGQDASPGQNASSGQNAEADLYKTAGLHYAPAQAPFQNVAELRFVLGLSPKLVDLALPFVTVFNGHAEVDVNVAAPEVIASLPNMTPDLVAAILAQRDPRNPRAVTPLLGQRREGVAIGGLRPVRTTVRVSLDDGRKISAEVVLLAMDSGKEPYRILAWRDDFDGAV